MTHACNPGQLEAERHAGLNRRLRQAFMEGAEEHSRRRLGRGLTAKELERILWHDPGDVVEEREEWGLHGSSGARG